MPLELLAPAGNLEKAEIAYTYGADAVYVGAGSLSLREAANLQPDELTQAIKMAHDRQKKLYVALNLFAHNHHLKLLPEYLAFLSSLRIDGVIVSDPGIFQLTRRYAPWIPIHISTQANITNSAAALFWEAQGAKRLILARELTLQEIKEIRNSIGIELEIFVHGAMCLSYSGRCWLSLALAGRDGNAGNCAQPCRWNYAICEETRPGVFLPVETGEKYTAVMSSKDLCLLEEIPNLIEIGIDSVKIEGRMKSSYYIALTTKIYRQAIDFFTNKTGIEKMEEWREELTKLSNRGYTKGFFLSDEMMQNPLPQNRTYDYVGLCLEGGDTPLVEIKNGLSTGERVEIVSPDQDDAEIVIDKMYDENGARLTKAHAGYRVRMDLPLKASRLSILRRKCPG